MEMKIIKKFEGKRVVVYTEKSIYPYQGILNIVDGEIRIYNVKYTGSMAWLNNYDVLDKQLIKEIIRKPST